MAFVKLECPNCKAPLELDDSQEIAYCKYCKTKISLAEHIHHHVQIDGIATSRATLTRANQLLQDNNYEAASKLFIEVLQSDPASYEAWWGRYCCENAFAAYYGYQDKYGNSGPYTKASIIAENLKKYAYRAIEYAPEEMKSAYRQAISDDEQFVQRVAAGDYDTQKKRGAAKGGCYIATAVYGSYEAPEVMILRRFRDDVLGKNVVGCAFVRVYYAISPFFARRLAHSRHINSTVRHMLDKFVAWLER